MNEIVKQDRNIIASFDDASRAAQAMSGSGFFQDAKTAQQAIVKILAGQELGFGPFASMTGVAIIQGKPAIGANLQAAAIKRTGKYNYRVLEMTDKAVELEFFEGGKAVGKSRFTMEDAAAAGLSAKDNWKKFPRNMLFARAISNGVKWYAPDIFNGATVYTPDELGASEDDNGNIIDVPATLETLDKRQAEYQQSRQVVTVPAPPEPITGDLDKDFPALRYDPETLRNHVQDAAKRAAAWAWNEKQDKLLAAMLGAALPDDTDRHVVQYFLTGYQSLREMPSGEKNALLKWIEPAKGSDGKYYPSEMAVREAKAALEFASAQMGQQQLMQ